MNLSDFRKRAADGRSWVHSKHFRMKSNELRLPSAYAVMTEEVENDGGMKWWEKCLTVGALTLACGCFGGLCGAAASFFSPEGSVLKSMRWGFFGLGGTALVVGTVATLCQPEHTE